MIKKAWFSILAGVFLLSGSGPAFAVTNDAVIAMVQNAADQIVKDAPAALMAINDGEDAYISSEDPDVYVFVYDADINIVAHLRPDLVGKNFKGKADPNGKMFRDDIVNQAIAEGKTWVDYSYQKPGGSALLEKTTYAVSVQGSDGKTYVVCAGKYKE